MSKIIAINAGDTCRKTLTYTDAQGDPISLAEYNDIHMQMRSSPGASVMLEISLGNDTITRLDNTITLIIEVPQDACGIYMSDIEFVKSNGERRTMGMLLWEIIPDITRVEPSA